MNTKYDPQYECNSNTKHFDLLSIAMEEENAWVFDSLVCFLNGPIWNAPLQTFIEEKSLIFEPNNTNAEEYMKIFDEFKNLVDFMLGNFMEDIGITPEQFEKACKEGKNYQVAFDHNLFEQIWAANDYEMFKRMMIQRNVELQLQALELIERKYGITPQSFIPKSTKEHNVQEIPVTIENSSDLETKIMHEVEKEFPDIACSDLEVETILEEKELLEKALQESKEQLTPDHKQLPLEETAEKLSSKNEATKNEKTTEIDAVELRKRQNYLRAQRDKLVALKKDARRKQLDATNSSGEKSATRPKSAKAAMAVLSGGQTNPEPQELVIRRTLAERLRSEVVGKEKK